MKWFSVPVLFFLATFATLAQDLVDQNVNSRYTVEGIELESPAFRRLSKSLRSDLEKLVGERFNPQLVGDLAGRIKDEIHRRVTHKIERGKQPEHVRVVFFAQERRWEEDETHLDKIAYHQKQGWSGGLTVDFIKGPEEAKFGIVSDGDNLLERYAGFTAGLSKTFDDRVRAQFNFGAFHQQWNDATLRAMSTEADRPGIYRERYKMEPSVTFMLVDGLSVSAGLSIQHYQVQFPAARYDAANSFETTLRYRKSWGQADTLGQEVEAGYALRAATNILGSDVVYARHSAHVEYALRHGDQVVVARMLTGRLSGTAPLFERFALGNSTTLRGWNKFDISPIGADRMAHGSVGYRFKSVGAFYDTGSVWDHDEEAQNRHSVGVTVALGALKEGPYVTMAVPIRNGVFQPLFILGMNF